MPAGATKTLSLTFTADATTPPSGTMSVNASSGVNDATYPDLESTNNVVTVAVSTG